MGKKISRSRQIPPRHDLKELLAKVELDLDNIVDPDEANRFFDRIERVRQWMKDDTYSHLREDFGNPRYLELWNRGRSVRINGIEAEHLSRDDLLAVVGWQSKLSGSRFLATGA